MVPVRLEPDVQPFGLESSTLPLSCCAPGGAVPWVDLPNGAQSQAVLLVGYFLSTAVQFL